MSYVYKIPHKYTINVVLYFYLKRNTTISSMQTGKRKRWAYTEAYLVTWQQAML